MEIIQQLLVDHMKAAIEDTEVLDLPARKLAETADDPVDKEGAEPITGDQLTDGEYTITVNTGAKMFKITGAKLTVKDGEITATVTMSGKSYTWFFMGSTDELVKADDSAFIPYKESADGSYTFEIPVEALDQAIVCASYSKNKDQWYPRAILFRADSLPEGAIG
jgi:hypothetical protein